MSALIAIYVTGACLWGVFSVATLRGALDMLALGGDDEDRERVKRRARIVLATPVWPLGLLVATVIGLHTLIRYAQGKVPE